MIPGRRSTTFYVCIGVDIRKFWSHEKPKSNWVIIVLSGFSVGFYLFAVVRIYLFRKKIKPITLLPGQPVRTSPWTLQKVNNLMDKQTLANLASIAVEFMSLVPVLLLSLVSNFVISPDNMNIYPYYLIVYVKNHLFPFAIHVISAFNYYRKSAKMREAIKRECSNVLSKAVDFVSNL